MGGGDDGKEHGVRKRMRREGPSTEPAAVNDNDSRGDSDGCVTQRRFPHVEGNWATLIYLRPSDRHQLGRLRECAKELCSVLRDHPATAETGLLERACVVKDLHVSLSRTLVLRLHEVDPVVEALHQVAATSSSLTLDLGGRGMCVHVNESLTTAFLGVKVGGQTALLDALVSRVDQVLAVFGQPSFYQDRSFHLSLVSWPLVAPKTAQSQAPPAKDGAGSDAASFQAAEAATRCEHPAVGQQALFVRQLQSLLPEAELEALVEDLADDVIVSRFVPTEIVVKAGNKAFSLALPARQ
eukprot:m.303770 g.303770  ORF g.303770 m.303770 type:complete len:297 (+) comp19595_c1_seq2:38-928(+)